MGKLLCMGCCYGHLDLDDDFDGFNSSHQEVLFLARCQNEALVGKPTQT